MMESVFYSWILKFNTVAAFKRTFGAMETVILLFVVTGCSMLDFANEWIWNPIWTMGILLAVLIADLISGFALSVKRSQGFSSRKFNVWILSVFGFLFILGVSYNLPRINEEFGFTFLTPLLIIISRCFFLLILLNTLLSAIKNMVLLGAIRGTLGDFFYKYIDTYKNRTERTLRDTIKDLKQNDNAPTD